MFDATIALERARDFGFCEMRSHPEEDSIEGSKLLYVCFSRVDGRK